MVDLATYLRNLAKPSRLLLLSADKDIHLYETDFNMVHIYKTHAVFISNV